MNLEQQKVLPKPNHPLDRFRLEHPQTDKILKALSQKEIKAVGIMAISLITGLLARHEISFSAVGNWFTERVSSALGVDTGPTPFNPLIEGASALAFIGSLGYLIGGSVFEKYIKGTLKRQGLEPLSKKGPQAWKDHTVVLDVTRGVYDAIEELKPNEKVVLIHDGRLIKEGEVEGGSINSKKRRNLNSVGLEHLSDSDFISWWNPEKAKEIIINLCSVDSILGSYSDKKNQSKLPISVEKIFNVLMTLNNYLSSFKSEYKPRIKILAPEGLKLEIEKIIDLLGGQSSGIERITPESIFVEEVREKTEEKTINFITDIKKLSSTLKSLGLKTDSTSNIVFVYCSTDDLTILKAAEAKKAMPGKQVVACIERNTNLDEAKKTADFVWELPSIVAQKL